MIAALAWEESRTGGVIAAWTSFIAVLVLNYFRFAFGIDAMTRSPGFVAPIVLGVPLLIACLLILNPNNSGHLVGGFSIRVLRLPISTRASVAVALIARTLFVGLSSAFIVVTSQTLFLDSAGFSVVGLVVLFYLLAQVLDWLREPFSGLSTLLVICCGVAAILLIRNGWVELWSGVQTLWVNPLAVLIAPALVYIVAVSAVHATRVGWRAGVPELWEWPGRASFLWPTRRRPFSSPMAAQIWYELRHSAAWLLGLMIGLWVILYATSWLVVDTGPGYRGQPDDPRVHEVVRAVLPFVSLLLAMVIQGLRAPMLRFRSAPGNADYPFLVPLTSAQLAFAHIAAGGLVFVPTVAIALAGHFYGTLVVTMLEGGLKTGATSVREAAWILLSRGLLVALIAWPFMAVKTRLFRWAIGALILTAILAVVWYVWTGSKDPSVLEALILVLMIALIGLTAGTYAHALRKRAITTGVVTAWATTWALVAWLLAYTMWEFEPNRSVQSVLATLIASLACAALVPLPYIAVVLDFARQRHGVSRRQDAAQHNQASSAVGGGPARAFVRIGAVCVVLFVAWLCWPARPSYESLWRSKGYPATLAELDAWYDAVPDESNAALEYIAVANAHDELFARYHNRDDGQESAPIPRDSQAVDRYDNLLIVGRAEVDRGEPVLPEVWAETQIYWNQVTSQVAPSLKEVAEKDSRLSRYALDLRAGPAVDLHHLARVRGLGRELHVDALQWVVVGDTAKAIEALVAILPVADSLSNEPTLISQLVRFAIEGILFSATEDVMNRAVFTEEQLAQLQQAFGNAARTPGVPSPMDRAFVGESLFHLSQVGTGDANIFGVAGIQPSQEISADFIRTPFYALLFPAAAERMVAAQVYSEILDRGSEPDIESLRSAMKGEFVWREEDMPFIAPLAWMVLPPVSRARDTEWRSRTQLQIAQTALAVERYRLANGRLPDDLGALMPAYLEQIPTDFYAGEESLRYRQRENGEFVVYSVGFDGEDDLGEELDRPYWDGDLTFTVSARAD